jgi:Protein of unknown function (DUF4240)
MDETQFWALIETSRDEHRACTEEQVEWLRTKLEAFEPDQILAFEKVYLGFFAKAYSYHLWDAAYLLFGGCSDDSFMDFRAGLIAQGQQLYTAILEQPDDLVSLFEDAEETILIGSDIQYLAQKIYEAKTGLDMPLMLELPDTAVGEHLDESEFETRYPKLWAYSEAQN